MVFEFNKNEKPFGGVLEWFKTLVFTAKITKSICKWSERYLKNWTPLGGLIVSIFKIKFRFENVQNLNNSFINKVI